MGVRLGIDTGGTFTDFAVVDEAGRFRVFKTPTTPRAPDQAVFAGIQALAEEAGVSVGGFLADVDLIVHGTTIATNAVIQRTGPKVGILHTDGFRDTLFLRDGFKPDRYNLHLPPPDPLIPRHLRLGAQERLLYTGEVLTLLDETSLRGALKTFARAGVESIAVCLLWSFANPAREARAADIIAQEMPDTYVALNSDALPALREYPRARATTLRAYVGPVLGPYLTKVAVYLAENGYRHDLLIMQVTGGSARTAEAEKRPVLAVGSGPAAGSAAGLAIGSEEDGADLMVVAMGGTSFDASLITGGAIPISQQIKIEEMPIGVAAVDVHSVGAGGGSIAWIDPGGMLRVSPRSAGADPGPACCGLGGTEPTVSDANVILGYLNPELFLDGRMKLDRRRSEQAMESIPEPLGLSVVEAAAAVYRLANTTMVGAMRAVSVMRGADPRSYTLVVGGTGGTPATKIAEELGLRKAIYPTVAGGLCAFGMLVADVKHSYLATHPTSTATMDIARINEIFAEREVRAVEELESQGFGGDDIALSRFAGAKYPYQLHEFIVPVPRDR